MVMTGDKTYEEPEYNNGCFYESIDEIIDAYGVTTEVEPDLDFTISFRIDDEPFRLSLTDYSSTDSMLEDYRRIIFGNRYKNLTVKYGNKDLYFTVNSRRFKVFVNKPMDISAKLLSYSSCHVDDSGKQFLPFFTATSHTELTYNKKMEISLLLKLIMENESINPEELILKAIRKETK